MKSFLKHILPLLTLLPLPVAAQVKVAVMGINDFHAAFVASPAKQIAGAAALVETVDSLKQVYPLHVVLSAGDNFGGSYFHKATNGQLMPVLFNALDIRLSAVGNHEFDEGQRALAKKWQGTPLCPADWSLDYVCANVREQATGRIPAWAQPVASVPLALPDGRTLRVAFAGLITSSTPEQTSARRLAGLSFDGRYAAVLDSVMKLPEGSLLEDANLRILLTHIGSITDAQGQPQWDDKDAAQLATLGTPRWHGFLSGHTHQKVCGHINAGKLPIVQGHWHGDYVNLLVCTIDTATLQVTAVEPRHVAVTPKAHLSPKAAGLQAQVDSLLRHTLTEGGKPLGLQLCTAREAIQQNYAMKYSQTRLGSLVCAAYAETFREAAHLKPSDVVVGCSHFGTLRAGLPQGPVSVLDVGEALPFANRLKVYELTGRQMEALVEFGLHNERFGYLQTANLEVEKDKEGHVKRLFYTGPLKQRTPLKPKKKYFLVTDEYITTGGDGYLPDLFPADREVTKFNLPTTTDAFLNYLQQLQEI